MSNLNTYGLPQMTRMLGDTGSINDSVYLPYLQQAVYDVDNRLQQGMSVTISGNDYTVFPAPGATSTLWNVFALGAVWRYRDKLLQDYLDDMEGMASIRDEVTSLNRAPVIKAKMQVVQDAKKAFEQELFGYAFSASGTAIVVEELGLAEGV